MALYNPDDSEYYDPYAGSAGGSDIASTLGSAVKSLLIVGGLNIVGSKLLGKVSSSLGKAVKAGAFGTKNSAYKIAQTISKPSLGDIVKNTAPVKEYTKWFRQTGVGQAMRERTRTLRQMQVAQDPMRGLARITTAFKSPAALAGVVGGAWVKNAVVGAPVSYAIDSALGITTRDLGLERKSIWDVPGQVSNALKWFGNESIYATAFSALGPIAGAGKSIAIKGLQEAFGGSFGKYINKTLQGIQGGALPKFDVRARNPVTGKVDSSLNHNNFYKPGIANRSNQAQTFASKVINTAMHYGRTIRETVRYANRVSVVSGQSFKEGFARGKTLSQKVGASVAPMVAALRNVKALHERARVRRLNSSSVSSGGINAAEMLTILAHTPTSMSGEKSDISEFIKKFGPEFKRSRKKNIVDHVHKKLKRVTVGDVASEDWIKDVSTGLSRRFPKNDVDILMGHVRNMAVGTHIYHGHGANITGGGVDLSMFDPVRMMKRALAPLVEHQWRVPLSKLQFSIGDITGWNDMLSEKPDLMYFRNKPDFSLGLAYDPTKMGEVTVGDLAKTEDALFVYTNGKWGVFDGDAIRTVDTGRRLQFARQHSKAKGRELDWIKKQRLIQKFGEDAGLDLFEKQHNREAGLNNKFFGWLHNKGVRLPGIVDRAVRAFNDKMGGRVDAYMESAAKIFGNEGVDDAYRFLPTINNVYEHTSQVYSRILHDKEALTVIGEFSGARLKKDLADVVWSNRSVREKYEALGLDINVEMRKKPEIHEAIEMIEAFPKEAQRDIVHKRLGLGSDMNSYDVANVGLMDTALSRDYWSNLAGNGAEHPLISASDRLFAMGKITEKERDALKLHAKLAAFSDKSLFSFTGASHKETELQRVIGEVRSHAKERNWNVLEEIKDFISSSETRSPSIGGPVQDLLWQHRVQSTRIPQPFTSVPKGILGAVDYGHGVADTLGQVIEEISPFRRTTYDRGIGGTARYIGKNILAVGAAYQAYNIADAIIANTPIMDHTSFDGGITGFLADNVAKTRLFAGKLSDKIGITAAAKYFEGLAPKSTSTIPGMIIGAAQGYAFGGGILSAAKSMIWGGVINRLASPFLPDATKSYEELREIYSGREQVPIMKSPTWLLGSTPWEGTKVEAYSPNWYVRAKSRWKETETMYGSAFRKLIHEPIPLLGFNIGDIVDPYYMERLHYFSRPYPLTGEFGSEVPIIGGLVSSTVGRIIKPQKTMHQEFLQESVPQVVDDTSPFANPPPTAKGMGALMAPRTHTRDLGGRTSLYGAYMYGTTHWADTAARKVLNDMTNAAGLQGFIGATAYDKLVGNPKVMPTLETAGRIASMSRSFFDLNLGGLGVLTEPLRRLISKPEYREYGINPIPNMMPEWLGEKFTTGDAYSKLLRGELRLPGKAYLTTHPDTVLDMPSRASMFGGTLEHSIQYFTGLLPPVLKEEYDILEGGTETHALIQDMLSAEGALIEAESLVVDVKNRITGHVDAIIRDGQGGRGRRALEIKTINEKAFNKLDAPKDQHVGQLNFYLRQLGIDSGTIMYVVRDNPAQVKTFDVRYSENRWQRDLNKLVKARQIAADMMQKGIGDTLGYSYSWLDRLMILADVAPSSKEFKEAKTLVEMQAKFGQLTDKQITKYETALKHRQARMRKYELYPLRFRGQVLSPSTEKNIESINENIKAPSEYNPIERVIGAGWENFTNTNFFVINKLWSVKDPLEHYKMSRLYGKEFKPWDEPYRSFIEPLGRGLVSKTNPLDGLLGWASAGQVVGGPVFSALGGAIGAVWGTVHGLYRGATGTAYIPGLVREQRQIEEYFDAAKYAKAKRLSELSNGLTSQQYQDISMGTLFAFNHSDNQTVANLFRSTPYSEKPYIEAWLDEKDPQRREEILRHIPANLANALRAQWSKADGVDYTKEFISNTSAEMAAGMPTINFDQSIFDPNVELEDIKLKTIERHGFDSHEFGLGWSEQQYRMLSYDNEIRATELERYGSQPIVNNPSFNQGQIRSAISSTLNKAGINAKVQVHINNYNDGNNIVNIVVKRDRSRTIINALNNRNKWM